MHGAQRRRAESGYAHHEHGGQENAKAAVAWTGFIPGLTIFCDTGYIILSGIVRTISATSQLPMPLLASILGTSLFAVHCLVPTHPGALAAATTMNANLGLLVVASIVFAVPGLIAAYFWSSKMCKGMDYAPATMEAPAQPSTAQLPSFAFSLLPVVLPVGADLHLHLADHLWPEGRRGRSLSLSGQPRDRAAGWHAVRHLAAGMQRRSKG